VSEGTRKIIRKGKLLEMRASLQGSTAPYEYWSEWHSANGPYGLAEILGCASVRVPHRETGVVSLCARNRAPPR